MTKQGQDIVRRCNGGLGGVKPWCGAEATWVVGDRLGSQCFVCDAHADGHMREPIVDWFVRHGLTVPDEERARILTLIGGISRLLLAQKASYLEGAACCGALLVLIAHAGKTSRDELLDMIGKEYDRCAPSEAAEPAAPND